MAARAAGTGGREARLHDGRLVPTGRYREADPGLNRIFEDKGAKTVPKINNLADRAIQSRHTGYDRYIAGCIRLSFLDIDYRRPWAALSDVLLKLSDPRGKSKVKLEGETKKTGEPAGIRLRCPTRFSSLHPPIIPASRSIATTIGAPRKRLNPLDQSAIL